MFKIGLKRASTALAAAALGAVLLAPAAHAAPLAGATTVPTGHKAGVQHLQRGLKAIRFDPAVAAAHGYKIITLPDGSQQSVPVNPADPTRKPSPPIKASHPGSITPNTTQDTEYGDCGASFIEGDVVAPHTIYLRSGFILSADRPGAVAYNWSIALYDDYGQSYQGASGPLDFQPSWNGTWLDLTQYGVSLDDVTDFSDAILADGTVCGSYGPFIFLNPGF